MGVIVVWFVFWAAVGCLVGYAVFGPSRILVLGPDSSVSPRKWPFKKGARETVVEVKGTFSSNSAAILIEAALNGFGIIKVPRYTVRAELASGKLKPIFDDITHSQERMRAYYSKTKFLPAKTRAFIELLQTAMKSQE